MGVINVGGYNHFDQASLLDISGYVKLAISWYQHNSKPLKKPAQL